MNNSQKFDIAVIGAGMAGLVCAQELQKAGYSVVVLEKSRGVGGRMATRRVSGSRADHGVRYLEPTGKFLQQLINNLKSQKNNPDTEPILQLWTDKIYELTQPQGLLLPIPKNCYIAPQGMNSVGKFLAQGLDIWFSRRVQTMQPIAEKNCLGITEKPGLSMKLGLNNNYQENKPSFLSGAHKSWCLTLEITNDAATEKPTEVIAKAVVLAIPAPQALMILEQPVAEIQPEFLEHLRFVEYDPCITVMAGYSPELQGNLPEWRAIAFPNDDYLDWVGVDSSKRSHPTQPVFVIQSSAKFATTHLDTPDLQPVGKELLEYTAQQLLPWLSNPEWLQVHRWRYAFCRQALNVSCLTTEMPLPLVGAGDWCGGNNIEGAFASGLAAANWLSQIGLE
ncbi:FAD-dependent oxidoreductase [Hydrocoleum sp. CS-953]|uniref:NAD(P)/FAD-dependent oxidoreductase n=1 Tax=Hydrocoleum sp. CS-953 TaxID=1671698 RepID=UPI000B9C7456|nr:FAD-dependent oxidoreductase [Hydrocoleum sp. CS-953]OZH52858.1 FAD-dependent oxidoreductase [Hydrocoleum sp. CS-953]